MSTPTIRSLKGYQCRREGNTPVVHEYEVDPTSAAIRQGDPVKQVAGGLIKKALASDTAILGFAEEPSDPAAQLDREIPAMGAKKNPVTGNVLLRVAVAGGGNIFTARTKNAPTQAMVTKTYDLIADVTDTAGFVIDNVNTPVTNLVQILSIVKKVSAAGTYTEVDFHVPAGKSQYAGVSGA